ncbi:MAG: hypothetical protein HC876_05430 [Chloroflexaceae bacterium]|nr:hypothetical protein [Chloroflexaceae bacterium]
MMISIQRIQQYPIIQQQVVELRETLAASERQTLRIIRQFTARRRFQIDRVVYQNKRLYILVRKREKARLLKDDILTVMHEVDNALMGTFVVMQEREEGYFAVGTDDVDRLWLADVINRGGETGPPPGMVAIRIERQSL